MAWLCRCFVLWVDVGDLDLSPVVQKVDPPHFEGDIEVLGLVPLQPIPVDVQNLTVFILQSPEGLDGQPGVRFGDLGGSPDRIDGYLPLLDFSYGDGVTLERIARLDCADRHVGRLPPNDIAVDASMQDRVEVVLGKSGIDASLAVWAFTAILSAVDARVLNLVHIHTVFVAPS